MIDTPIPERVVADDFEQMQPAVSVWRANLLWLIMSWLAGIAIGGVFMLGAYAVHTIAAPQVTAMIAAVGVALLVGPGLWMTCSIWRQSRNRAKSPLRVNA